MAWCSANYCLYRADASLVAAGGVGGEEARRWSVRLIAPSTKAGIRMEAFSVDPSEKKIVFYSLKLQWELSYSFVV
jgi:hypothetical protein